MSTLTIAENWAEFPISPNVPSRTAVHLRKYGARIASTSGISALGHRLLRSRLLRLELLVVTATVALGCFAWQTLGQESALQQAAANQSRSIATLTDSVLRQDKKVSDLNQSVQTATRDLAAQMSRLSSQLKTQDREMAAIRSRLSGVEIALAVREQVEPVGE
jgi:hypothetical protein